MRSKITKLIICIGILVFISAGATGCSNQNDLAKLEKAINDADPSRVDVNLMNEMLYTIIM